MRLKTLKLKNFRGYQGEIAVSFDDLTAFVGRNDVGKSSVLDALAIFFDSKLAKFDALDRCVRCTQDEVRIGCVFADLPSAIVLDANATTSLGEEHLLNADGDLELHRIWSFSGERKSESIVAVAQHPTVPKLDELLLKKNAELKKLANDLTVDVSTVDLRSNPALRKAIWASAGDLRLREVEVPLNKEDAKAIWQKIQEELPTFALFRADRPSTDDDAEVQDPMKLAVQEALKGVETELERIKDQVKKKALAVAEQTLEKLKEIAPTLAGELQPTFKNEPKWDSIFKLALTCDEQIPINKRGSGVRRLVLLSFFRADADRRRAEEGRSNIIYAIEEPETSQHPDNQRMLIEALLRLAAEDGCQVIITTHVPALVGLVPVAGIRHVSIDDQGSRRVAVGEEGTLQRVAAELGILPDERVRVLVCVEGPNDVAFLRNIAAVLRSEDPSVVDLRSDPRVVVLPLGGSTLQDWVNEQYLRPLNKPEVHIYDRDTDVPPKYEASYMQVNSRSDGSKGFLTSKRELENYLHKDAVSAAIGVAVEIDDTSDIPELVARERHRSRYPDRPWDDIGQHSKDRCCSYAKRLLNDEASKAMTAAMLSARGGKDEVSGWFEEIRRHLQ